MDDESNRLEEERSHFLGTLERVLEPPLIVLGFIWLILTVVELIRGLPPLFEIVNLGIWAVFILDFVVKFAVAPHKGVFLGQNILTLVSLLVPALRVFRLGRILTVVRSARAARSLQLVRVFGSMNRGMRSLGRSMRRRGLGYVAALSGIILLGGSAGIYLFERSSSGGPADLGDAVWWTAMILTTMGSSYWPVTPEGRILCIFLAFYAFAVFGYFTAALATFFVGREAGDKEGEVAGADQVEDLRREVQALIVEVRALRVKGES